MNETDKGKNLRLLVIDDNRAVHEDFRKILCYKTGGDNGLEDLASALFQSSTPSLGRPCFEVDSAYQGLEGLEAIVTALKAGRPYAAAFVDIRMPPGLDGVETAAKIWEICPDLQVVLCTAYSDYSWEEIVARLKISDRMVILKKPFDNVEVLQLAIALTEKWRLHQHVKEEKNRLEKLVEERTRSLKQSEERYQMLFSKNPLPLWAFDEKTLAILAVNETAVTNYGYPMAEFLHLNLNDIHLPDTPPLSNQSISENEEGRAVPARHRRQNGEIFDVEVIVRPIMLDGRPVKLMLASDVSEKKALETQLLRSQRIEAIGTLAVGLAHDLNNILAPIMMSTDNMREPMTPTEQRDTLDCIELCVKRGAEIVRQILIFGRGVSGERIGLKASELFTEIGRIIQETFPRDIVFELDTAENLWPVVGDKTQLHQVLLNLCVNSRDSMPNGGQLTLRSRNFAVDKRFAALHMPVQAGPHILIQVIDTGSGINPSEIEKIFDPFFTTKGPGKGTGLGLSSALGIIKSHHGSIWVESEVSRGTTFNVLLPAAFELADAPPPAKGIPVAGGRGETILLVDDELSILSTARRSLERQGYNVLVSGGGPHALDLFRRNHQAIDLVVTDYMMPEINGVALIKAMKEIKPRVKIVAASGLGKDLGKGPENKELELAGADSFLPKPYTVEDLLVVLQQLLKK